MVERQLCKLEVRGSNPLASSLRSRRRRERGLSRRSLGKGGHLFDLLYFSRATTRQASYATILLCLYLAERSRTSAFLYRFDRRSADASQRLQLWSHPSQFQMETVAVKNLHRALRSTPSGSTRAIFEIRFRSRIYKAAFLIPSLCLETLFFDLRFAIADLNNCALARQSFQTENRRKSRRLSRRAGL